MRARLSRPSLLVVALATMLLYLADWGALRAGDSTVPGGPLDELAHFLTVLLVLWAVFAVPSWSFWGGALAASVLIDLDHIPDRLGAHWLTAGTPRPYTHSLLTVVVVLLVSALWPRRRVLLLGIAFGLVLHFWRDLSETGTGVSLLWPFSKQSFSVDHTIYLVIIAGIAVVAATRSVRRGALGTAPRRRQVPQIRKPEPAQRS